MRTFWTLRWPAVVSQPETADPSRWLVIRRLSSWICSSFATAPFPTLWMLSIPGRAPNAQKSLGHKPSVYVIELHSTRERLPECWICYDSERTDAGPLIQPCQCKGDVGIVHHDCLRKWLIESWNKPDNLLCKVCKQQYVLERGQPWLSASFPVQSWLYTVGAVTVMCGSAVGAWIVIQLYEEPVIRITAVGVAALVSYVCLKFLGFSAVTAYQRAKVSAVRILGRRISHATMSSSTSSIASSQQNVSGSPSKHLGPEYIKVNLMSSGFPTLDETRL